MEFAEASEKKKKKRKKKKKKKKMYIGAGLSWGLFLLALTIAHQWLGADHDSCSHRRKGSSAEKA